jgi:sucrose-6-phosphate hydrolase SacC (GH32 family)
MAIYQEKYRPQFHFTAQSGWLNDPNGLIFFGGEYHLFYQHTPADRPRGSMHWGHAVSSDLVHWKELPIALYPTEECCMAYSGSGVVDVRNTTGFKTGEDDPLVLAYTRTGRGQSLAYSNDRGRTWQEFEGNPVLPDTRQLDEHNMARDPKVLWHASSKRWVMVLYELEGFTFFQSPDLKSWEKVGRIEEFFECPDLFELPVDGDNSKRKWVLLGADGQYLIGKFDGACFTPETAKQYSCGPHFYASQTWNNIPADDGRRIQIAWMRGGSYPGMPFTQQMTFPCELQLRTFFDGIRLCRSPVRELRSLYKNECTTEGTRLVPGKKFFLPTDSGLLHLKIEMDIGDASEIEFYVRGAKINYSVREQQFMILEKIDFPAPNGRIQWEVLIDRTSLEIFNDSGCASAAYCFMPHDADEEISLSVNGGSAKLTKLHIYELSSAWSHTACCNEDTSCFSN